ncbi:MAG TPA: hypothetical protein PLP29_04390 [Candidatus Ozemobacteraceae bacterium]|nr:hypothetical protein [Candidatus Ozemobacteraceae bacterium]
MEQSPKLCPRCQQANFPIAEYCRHCGEPLFEMGSISRRSLPGRFIGHCADGILWAVDEVFRWWEIGKLTVRAKSLRRRRADLVGKSGGDAEGAALSGEQRERLVTLSDEIARLETHEEFLRKRVWALTPEILFLAIVLLFIGGILVLKPRTDLALPAAGTGIPAGVAGSIGRTAEFRIDGHRVVTTAAWWQGSLFIGGDGGLTRFEPATGLATHVPGLPAGMFVRHLAVEGNRLLIAGYGGVFALDGTGLTSVYEGAGLPADLVNRIAPTSDGGHLLGTIGYGLLKGRNGVSVVLLGTQGLTPRGFEWLDGELWVAHERGLLRGDGTSFSPVHLQVLAGRNINALAADRSTIYVGTDDGLVAGFKNIRDWVWTPLSPGEPRVIRDLAMLGDSLLVCSEEGLFRYRDGRFEKLTGSIGQKALALNGEFVATVGPNRVILHTFAGVPTVQPGTMPAATPQVTALPLAAPVAEPVQPILPTVGTYVPTPGPVAAAPATPAPSQPSVPAATPAPLPVVQSAPAPTAVPAAPQPSDPVFGTTPLPPSLRGPAASCIAWDGARLWVGTTNDGVWFFENGTWTVLNRSNGGLADDQVVALWRLGGKSYLYSWILGILSLENGRAVPLVKAGDVADLVSAAASGGDLVLLLKAGHLKRVAANGALETAGRIPEDFFRAARFVQVLRGQPVVVTDQGVLEQDQSGRWAVTFYPGEPTVDVKATASVVGDDGRLYVGLSNGSIHAYADRRAVREGSIPDAVRVLAWDQGLWLAGGTTVYRTQAAGGSPVPAGGRADSRILGMQPMAARNAVVVVTLNGLKTIPLNP